MDTTYIEKPVNGTIEVTRDLFLCRFLRIFAKNSCLLWYYLAKWCQAKYLWKGMHLFSHSNHYQIPYCPRASGGHTHDDRRKWIVLRQEKVLSLIPAGVVFTWEILTAYSWSWLWEALCISEDVKRLQALVGRTRQKAQRLYPYLYIR